MLVGEYWYWNAVSKNISRMERVPFVTKNQKFHTKKLVIYLQSLVTHILVMNLIMFVVMS
jgi:hypothetical protein